MKKGYLIALIPLCLLFFGCKKKTTKNSSTDNTKITTKSDTKVTTENKTTNNYEELLKDFYYEINGNEVILLGIKDENVKELVIPEGVTRIKYNRNDHTYNAFRWLPNLMKITLPESLEVIDKTAFAGCEKLVEIYNLSKTYELDVDDNDDSYITEYAYEVHDSLDEPSIIVEDDNYIFLNNGYDSVLYEYKGNDFFVKTPNNYIYEGETIYRYDIAPYAFYKKDLVTLELSNAVRKIGKYAFGGCYNLSQVIVGQNVSSIESLAFGSDNRTDEQYTVGMYNECNRLVEVINKSDLTIEKGNKTNGRIAKNALNVIDDIANSSIVIKDDFVFYVGDEDVYLTCYFGDDVTVTTPDNFTYNDTLIDSYIIKSYALGYRKNMKKLVISDAATVIQYGAIYSGQFDRNNETVEEIVIGNNVTFIQSNAFTESYVLKKLTLGSKVKNIKIGSFSYCSELTEVVILSVETLELDEESFYKPNNSDYKPIERVFFKGTKETWDNWPSDEKGTNNSQLFNATIYFYSEEKPTIDGNYWVIVNDEIVIWEKAE
ncbi:MAG: leucine-rich repeat domain-containing protein [bacterium]|nr:leucine-rich repeat domain-containing protein [bacterium]